MAETTKKNDVKWKLLSAVLAAALIAVSLAWAFTSTGKDKTAAPEAAAEGRTGETAVAEAETAQPTDAAAQKRKLIIDTDTGGDDAVALIIAAKDPNVDILGVTVSEGNVSLEQAVRNALMTLETAGSDAPVYAGAETSFSGRPREVFSVYGKDGMGDQDLIHPTRKAVSKNAVDFILETVKANPGEVEIVALGPVTNLALALAREPETMRLVKRCWSMGTAGFGHGNASPVAEFNVYHDAEAYQAFADSGMPITALGFDLMNEDVCFSKEELDALAEKSDLAAFVAKAFSGLVAFNLAGRGTAEADVPDGALMAAALWDGYILETQACHPVVITDDSEAYGQVILYKQGFGYDSGVTFDSYNFNVITKTASGMFKEKLTALLAG